LPVCPNCHTAAKLGDLIKEWDATPKKAPEGIKVTIHYWKCPKCGNKFRTATRTWPPGKEKKSWLKKLVHGRVDRGDVDAETDPVMEGNLG
jgi:hypothetical protein